MSTHGVALTTQADPNTTITVARVLCARRFLADIGSASRSARTDRYVSADRATSSSSQARRFDRPRSQANATCSRRAASSPLSAIDLLERIDLEIALGKDAFELRVLAFECSQSLDIGRFKDRRNDDASSPIAEAILSSCQQS